MKVEELELLIRAHKEMYTHGLTSLLPDLDPISDAEFDALVDTLRSLAPESVVLDEVGAKVPESSTLAKVAHLVPMVSLDKVTSIEEFEKWINQNNKILDHRQSDELFTKAHIEDLVLSLKADGVSVELEYEEGKVTRASTRGDGFVGEDITKQVRKMQGFKEEISRKEKIYLRGEMILTNELHQKYFSNMKNARNAVSGIVKRLDTVGCEHIQILYFSVIGIPLKEEFDKLLFLKELGLPRIPTWLIKVGDLENLVPKFEEKRSKFAYEIDGLVLKVNALWLAQQLDLNRVLEGKNPKSQIAYKFQSEKKVSKLIAIEWSLGARGHVTPIGVVEPIDLGGVTVQRASLANVAEIHRLGVRIGDDVLVERANDVIPKILKVVKEGDDRSLNIPEQCPNCDSVLSFDDTFLTCLNRDCSGKKSGSVRTWIVNLGIKDFGEHLIDQLVDKQIVCSISDLYALKIADLVEHIDRFGERSSRKALKNLHDRKELTLALFLGSLGIKNCSESTFKLLVNAGYDTLDKILKVQVSDILPIKGIAEKTAVMIVEGLKDKLDEITALTRHLKIIEGSQQREGVLSGLTFQTTKKLPISRKDWEALVKQNGGLIKGVGKGLDYLVTEFPDADSSKLRKAKKLDIKIISYNEFIELLKG